MKLYIHTVPKAGTYFLPALLEQFGYRNSGKHIFMKWYQETGTEAEHGRNAPAPTHPVGFVSALNHLADGEVAFGHAPAPLLLQAFPHFQFICSYRHPARALEAEFVDFRYLRNDKQAYGPEQVPSDQAAFERYLARRGPGIVGEFEKMLSVATIACDSYFAKKHPDRIAFVEFESLRKSPEAVHDLLSQLGKQVSLRESEEALTAVLGARTRTSSSGLKLDRASLWSPKAERLYDKLAFEEIVERGRDFGWQI